VGLTRPDALPDPRGAPEGFQKPGSRCGSVVLVDESAEIVVRSVAPEPVAGRFVNSVVDDLQGNRAGAREA